MRNPWVALRWRAPFGSAADPPDQPGAAHLAEHLLAAQARPLAQALGGTSWGAETDREWTTGRVLLPAREAPRFQAAFDRCLRRPQPPLASEAEPFLAELAGWWSRAEHARTAALLRLFWGDHPAARPPVGRAGHLPSAESVAAAWGRLRRTGRWTLVGPGSARVDRGPTPPRRRLPAPQPPTGAVLACPGPEEERWVWALPAEPAGLAAARLLSRYAEVYRRQLPPEVQGTGGVVVQYLPGWVLLSVWGRPRLGAWAELVATWRGEADPLPSLVAPPSTLSLRADRLSGRRPPAALSPRSGISARAAMDKPPWRLLLPESETPGLPPRPAPALPPATATLRRALPRVPPPGLPPVETLPREDGLWLWADGPPRLERRWPIGWATLPQLALAVAAWREAWPESPWWAEVGPRRTRMGWEGSQSELCAAWETLRRELGDPFPRGGPSAAWREAWARQVEEERRRPEALLAELVGEARFGPERVRRQDPRWADHPVEDLRRLVDQLARTSALTLLAGGRPGELAALSGCQAADPPSPLRRRWPAQPRTLSAIGPEPNWRWRWVVPDQPLEPQEAGWAEWTATLLGGVGGQVDRALSALAERAGGWRAGDRPGDEAELDALAFDQSPPSATILAAVRAAWDQEAPAEAWASARERALRALARPEVNPQRRLDRWANWRERGYDHDPRPALFEAIRDGEPAAAEAWRQRWAGRPGTLCAVGPVPLSDAAGA